MPLLMVAEDAPPLLVHLHRTRHTAALAGANVTQVEGREC